MQRHRLATALFGLTLIWAGVHTAVLTAEPKATVEDIRKSLMQLPYYSVFDFIAFNYNRGTVTLTGYAYRGDLKTDAERAVKRVAGVDEVEDRIEVLPVSTADDDLRWKTYYAIYSDPFLSRYAPGGGMLWGHRHASGTEFHPFDAAPFPGMEPAGDYPIHIVVRNMKVMLLGVVDNDGDKTIAGTKARQVPGNLGVDNLLIVENARQTSKR